MKNLNKRVNAIRKNRSSRNAYRGVAIRADLRLAIYLRDSFRCLYCVRDLHGAAPTDVTLDHLKPHSRGGDNKPRNLITACRSCNCSRGDLPLVRFASDLAQDHIARNRRRSIRCYRTLAKAIIAGDAQDPRK